MTDTSGSQVWTCFYYPFGEQKWPESEQISSSHQFTGKEWDTDMSLNYFCQRYYDPTIGRFMSLDPERPAASSPYAYCLNNPLRFIDPLGKKAQVQSQEFLEKLFDEKWTLARSSSAQLDPDFFFKGWDWCPSPKVTGDERVLLWKAMFLLSSGIFTWDILTSNGWLEVNIGNFIREKNLTITFAILPGLDAQYKYAEADARGVEISNLPSHIERFRDNIWDLVSVIAHEATHALLTMSGGAVSHGALLRNYDEAVRRQELAAYGVELDLFGDLVSVDHWGRTTLAFLIYQDRCYSLLKWNPFEYRLPEIVK